MIYFLFQISSTKNPGASVSIGTHAATEADALAKIVAKAARPGYDGTPVLKRQSPVSA